MFDYESEQPDSSVLLCVLQLFFAPFGCLVLGVLMGGLIEQLLHVVTRDRRADLVLDYVVFILVGFALGYFIQTAFPRARYSGGLWVWVAPCCILALGILDQSRAPGTVIGTYFVFTPGDEGLGVALITLPAVASCCYSVGLVVASRSASPRRSEHNGPAF
jgi:hypothetical protein